MQLNLKSSLSSLWSSLSILKPVLATISTTHKLAHESNRPTEWTLERVCNTTFWLLLFVRLAALGFAIRIQNAAYLKYDLTLSFVSKSNYFTSETAFCLTLSSVVFLYIDHLYYSRRKIEFYSLSHDLLVTNMECFFELNPNLRLFKSIIWWNIIDFDLISAGKLTKKTLMWLKRCWSLSADELRHVRFAHPQLVHFSALPLSKRNRMRAILLILFCEYFSTLIFFWFSE